MARKIAHGAIAGLVSLALTTGLPIALAVSSDAAPVASGWEILASSNSKTRWIKSDDGFANVRSGPGASFAILNKLSNCTKVTVLETKNGWSRISAGGWVSNSLLGTGDGCGKPSPSPTQDQICRVTVGSFQKAEDARTLSSQIESGAFVRQINGRWVVQVGAFAIRSNAERRAAQFTNATVTCTAK